MNTHGSSHQLTCRVKMVFHEKAANSVSSCNSHTSAQTIVLQYAVQVLYAYFHFFKYWGLVKLIIFIVSLFFYCKYVTVENTVTTNTVPVVLRHQRVYYETCCQLHQWERELELLWKSFFFFFFLLILWTLERKGPWDAKYLQTTLWEKLIEKKSKKRRGEFD